MLSAAAGRVFDTKYKMFMVLELVTGGELLERCPPARPPALPPPASLPFADRLSVRCRLMDMGAYCEQDACDLFTKVMHAVQELHKCVLS